MVLFSATPNVNVALRCIQCMLQLSGLTWSLVDRSRTICVNKRMNHFCGHFQDEHRLVSCGFIFYCVCSEAVR